MQKYTVESIQEVVNSHTLKPRFTVVITPEAYDSVKVEIRDHEHEANGRLVWRGYSFELKFDFKLRQELGWASE